MDRHFPQARMNPEPLMIDRPTYDLRNSADMLVIDKVAANIFHIPWCRPRPGDHPATGHPVERTSVLFIIACPAPPSS